MFKLNLQGAMDAIESGIEDGLNEYSALVSPLITDSTPIDTGRLRQSERVDSMLHGRIFSANTSYAMEQHEMPYYHTVGRSHYILAPLQSTAKEAQKIIAENIKKNLR